VSEYKYTATALIFVTKLKETKCSVAKACLTTAYTVANKLYTASR